jgi:hypothetical protein
MRKGLIFLLLCAIHLNGMSQFYQAVHGSNFAGSLGVHNNPASALSHPKPWDLSLVGLQLRNSTNLLYLERYALNGKDKQLLAFLKNGDFKKRLNNATNLNLLNARIRLKNRLAVSFGANLRSVSNAKSSSYNFQDSLSNINNFLFINDKNQPLEAKIVTSSWLELYGSLAYNLLDTKRFIWNAGLSMKASKGLFGLVTTLEKGLFGRILPVYPVYQLNDINLRYVYSGNMDQWDPAKPFMSNLNNYLGRSEGGGSIDIGMEWFIKDPQKNELFETKTQYNYTWKFGVSLLDIGYAHYKHGVLSGNIAGLKYSVNGLVLSQKFDSTIVDLATFNDSAKTIAKQFNFYYGKFKVAHPTRLVLNIDRPLSDNISINAELNLPLSLFDTSQYHTLRTLSSFTFTPRMEEERYGIYMPMTINGDGHFWLGTAIRTGPLLFGIHNIIPFFQKTPYPNGGGYLAYVISPSEKLRKPKRKDVKCPD